MSDRPFSLNFRVFNKEDIHFFFADCCSLSILIKRNYWLYGCNLGGTRRKLHLIPKLTIEFVPRGWNLLIVREGSFDPNSEPVCNHFQNFLQKAWITVVREAITLGYQTNQYLTWRRGVLFTRSQSITRRYQTTYAW